MHILKTTILCLVALQFSYGQDQPEIAEVILPEIKRSGETGSLNCSVTRPRENRNYQVLWNRNTVTISSDDEIFLEEKFNKFVDGGYRKYEVVELNEGDRDKYILIIRRLQSTDAGNYTCKVQIQGSTDHPSKNGQMIVLVPPSIQQGSTTLSVSVNEEQDANLTCTASGYPTPNITWMRPNGKTMPKPFTDKITIKGNVLQLKQLGKTDRGVYRCIADNAVRPPAMFDTNLYVNFAPYAIPVQSSYGQAQNRLFDILLECRISGFPQPELRWYQVVKDGLQPITDDEKHVIHVLLNHGQTLSVSEFWYQLTIINVQANDYGDYICEGSNSLGTHQARLKLYETTECQGPFCYLRYDTDFSASSLLRPSPLMLAVFIVLGLFN